MDGDVLTWDATIAPGEWIVVVSEANADENGGGVAVALLDATIATGSSIDMEMALGGWIDLDTVWNDFALGEHHAGSDDNGSSMIQDPVEVTISIGDDIVWNKLMDRFSISSSQVDVVHTKHVFTVQVQAMAAGALPTAGGTSRLAADEICTLCSRLHCDNTRLDNTLEHCIGGIEQLSTHLRPCCSQGHHRQLLAPLC